jgi:hypothetical protein
MAKRLLAALMAAALAIPVPVLAGDGDSAPKKPEAPAPQKPVPPKEGKPAAAPAPATAARSPRSRREALRILDQILVSVNFDGTTVGDVVRHLGAVTGVNIVLGPALLKEGDPDLLKVTLRLQKVTARQVLEMTAENLGLGIGFQSGVLTLTTAKDARGRPTLRMYLLSDITMPIRDFPAPDLMLHPAGSERQVVEETETKPAFSDGDDILRLLKDVTGPGTWEDEGISATVMKEWLVVRQYEDVHEQIARVLFLLRSAR